MEWLNEPPAWKDENGTVTVTSAPRVDFWRKTRTGMIKDDAHFYYQEVSGDFVATARVEADYGSDFEQAGLMVRLDERVWLKCGIEYIAGVQYASSVTTRDVSDWGIATLPFNPPHIWVRLFRRGDTVQVSYSMDGEEYAMLSRTYLTDAPDLKVGFVVACPMGEKLTARFDEFTVRPAGPEDRWAFS